MRSYAAGAQRLQSRLVTARPRPPPPRSLYGRLGQATFGLAIQLPKGRTVHILRFRPPGSTRDVVGVFDGERVMEAPGGVAGAVVVAPPRCHPAARR